jgi:hypothetical protein
MLFHESYGIDANADFSDKIHGALLKQNPCFELTKNVSIVETKERLKACSIFVRIKIYVYIAILILESHST